MSTTIIAFFNNKGGVGKTTLVYHLAWMYQDLGVRVLAADLDPQANLSAALLSEDRLTELWPEQEHQQTLLGSIQPLVDGSGDFAPPWLEKLSDRLALLVGDIGLSGFEDQLSEVWPKCRGEEPKRALLVTSSFWRIVQKAAEDHHAELVLVDLGPNLGAINRAVLLAADYVVIPLSPDLFSLQGLRNLGPKLRTWRKTWEGVRQEAPKLGFELPAGTMRPAGYLVQQHSMRLDRPVNAYERWITRIPDVYQDSVLGRGDDHRGPVSTDPNCIALLKHYRSLIPMAQESHKPMFHLRPGDGALGSHFQAAQMARTDFEELARKIAERCHVSLATASRS